MTHKNSFDKNWDEYAALIETRKDSDEWKVCRESRQSHWEEFFCIKTDEKVLDAGCGHGEYSIFSLQDKARVWAFDYSKNMVLSTKARINNKNLKEEEIFVGSVTEIPYADEMFDTVFCLAVLDHLSENDRNVAIKELRRVLKPNGKLVLGVPNRLAYHWRLAFNVMRILKMYPKGDIHFFTPWEVKKLLTQNDFTFKKSMGLTICPPFSGIYTTDLRRITFLPNCIIKPLDRLYLFTEKTLRRISFFKPFCWHYFVEAQKLE